MWRPMAAVMGAMALVACGGNSVDGTVSGQSLEVADGLSFSSADGKLVSIQLSDQANVCSLWQSSTSVKGAGAVSIILRELNGAERVVPTPGEFLVGSTNASDAQKAATVVFLRTKADSCGVDFNATAASGTVTLSDYDASGAKGSFELKFPSGDELSGDFDVSTCEVPASPPTPSCQ